MPCWRRALKKARSISKWCSAAPARPVYLIGKPRLTIVIGMPAWRSALDRLGMSPEQNRQALAGEPT